MDKKLILAVAGSGKTRLLIEALDLERRFLLITYTENNTRNLRTRISRRFGFMPPNISVQSYFTFLHSSCFRPYLMRQMRSRGITFEDPTPYSNSRSLHEDERYLDGARRAYHCRMAKALEIKGLIPELRERVSRYYDAFLVDEVQDFDGHDFDFLLSLSAAPVQLQLVGDFYQHTFPTSRDGNKNSGLYSDLEKYRERFQAAGIVVDEASLKQSHRCGPEVCRFIREKIGIQIVSASAAAVQVRADLDEIEATRLFHCPKTIKLFYKEHDQFKCFSENWGASKGMDDFQDVCVVMTKDAWKGLKKNGLMDLVPQTRNKLYVACSRARGNLFLVPSEMFAKFCAKPPRKPSTKKHPTRRRRRNFKARR